jgi:DNA-binding Lrp family transcriptional regulator
MSDEENRVRGESNPMVSEPLMKLLFDLPFEKDLWEKLGQRVGLGGGELLSQVRTLFEQGMIREIGPIFSPAMLGYKTTLVAANVPIERLDEVAGIISAHAGVSHNYLRDNPTFNLWFTLATAGEDVLQNEINDLSKRAGLTLRRFDNIEQYKISFRLSDDVSQNPSDTKGKSLRELDSATQKRLATAVEILQRGLPLTHQPFETLAETTRTMTVDELLACGCELRKLKILRRFGVTWRHREIGFRENVLCVWQLPEEQIDAFVERIMTIGQITHCYRRCVYPDWPWSIYTMIHGRNREECEAIISQLSRAFSQARSLAMRTMKEYKKQRVIYRPKISK